MKKRQRHEWENINKGALWDTITKINRFGCWQMDVGDLIEWAKK